MQSEGGAAGTLHGALQAGALGTTFTASQGLLLMIPNMYKIAGELTPTVIHVAARALATHALSIFGDHSDVMAARATGWALLCSNSVQEAGDFALIAQAATLESRIPFLHFFDGFRTSHEVNKIEQLDDDDLRDDRRRPGPRSIGTRTVARPSCNAGHGAKSRRVFSSPRGDQSVLPGVSDDCAGCHGPFCPRTGRQLPPIRLRRRADAERVIVMMGSGAGPPKRPSNICCRRAKKLGLLKVRLFRPFSVERFSRLFRTPCSTLRCWTAPRNRAARANRSIWMWSPH